ncbi:MAG: DUF692 family protein [Planctomycetota bacterium]
MTSFPQRVRSLPRLGVGISTELGAGQGGLDIFAFAEERPDLIGFLEVGADVERGFDHLPPAWARTGRLTTYHFLDVNLEEGEDLDEEWTAATAALAKSIGAAWLCGDAGLWHVGPRERGHGTLMPPILCEASATEMAQNLRHLRECSGFEVLPENPPAHVYLGDLHLLDYFARVSEAGDCGVLLDLAHLAIYQRVQGHAPFTGLDGFPLDRIVEIHVAGGTPFEHEGRTFIDDDHGPEPLPEVWDLLEHVVEGAENLKAVVYECERNAAAAITPAFEKLNAIFPRQGKPA